MSSRYQVINEDLRPAYLGFHDLMSWRVERILLVASLYDSFVLEEDGQLTERIFSDYSALSLNFPPPRVTPVRSVATALKKLEAGSFDLVVTTLRLPDTDTAEFVLEVKRRHPNMPVILLAWDTKILKRRHDALLRAGLDRAFLWSGDTSILLALVKSVEDQANLDHDVPKGDVRIVVVVEDSVRYYSSLLPILYREIMLQTQALIHEGINDFHRIFRMRARPKLVLASTFEEAMDIFERYPENVLGFLSDIRFPRRGRTDPEAGFELVRTVRKRVTDIPFLLLSAEAENAGQAYVMGTSFLDKNAPDLVQRVRRFIKLHLGFGDFVFRTPDGLEEGRARDVPELLEALENASDQAIAYHARGNHFSHWLAARGEFNLARQLRPRQLLDHTNDVGKLRDDLIRRIRRSQDQMQRGVIADLSRGTRYYPTRTFSRLGSGSLGGKSRSVAFLGALLERANLGEAYPNITFGVPRTVALGAYVFEQFVEQNHLSWLASANLNDERVAEEFLKATLPEEIRQHLVRVLEVIKTPLAVRSSSLLEDSPDQPFAGVFHTYMVPNVHTSLHLRLHQLCQAIKLVYASTWFKAARGYMRVTGHNALDQKMGVAIQCLVGRRYGDLYYPCISGVAQTHNFYPVRYMKPEDGVAVVALGLGRTITEGERSLRFCPKHPAVIPELSMTTVLDATQREFWALDLSRGDAEVQVGDDYPLVKLGIHSAEDHGTLQNLGSVLSPDDDRLRDGLSTPGPRVVTFAPVLKWKVFPLAEILCTILERARGAMAGPAEIEFSAVLSGPTPEFQLLQIRPLTVIETHETIDLSAALSEGVLVKSARALGHGTLQVIRDVIYVRPDRFDRTKTREITPEVERCNDDLTRQDLPYLLVGPGRWGTSDPMVGIPVRWDQVCGAKVIVESDLPGFEVEPSQGNHFFHNLTSFGVFNLTVSFRRAEEALDWEWLEAQPAVWEGEYVRHVRFDDPLRVLVDGSLGHALVTKPVRGDAGYSS